MTNTAKPLFLRPGEGRRFPVGRPSITVKTEADTSPVAVFESEPPPGILTAPPHLHHDHTESFYVISGELEFRLGDRTLRGTAGAFFHVPQEVVHGFHNPGPDRAKLLILIYPADGLGAVEEMLDATVAAAVAPDPTQIRAILEKYHSEPVEV